MALKDYPIRVILVVSMPVTIKIISDGRTLQARRGELLSDALERSGIPLRLDCNKRGICGQCLVEILKGNREDVSEREKFWQKQKGLSRNHRLACQFQVGESLEIRLPLESMIQEIPVLPRLSPSFIKLHPAIKKYVLELCRPKLASPSSLFESILEGLGSNYLKISLSLLRKLGTELRKANFEVAAIVHRDKEILSLRPARPSPPLYGLAVDVGTTTLAMELVDLERGKTVDSLAGLNGQAKRGVDVVSRISEAVSAGDKARQLRALVLDSLNQLTIRLAEQNRISPSSIYEIVVSGNTAMTHLLLGVPVDSLGVAPYHAVFSRLPYLSAREVRLVAHPEAKVYFSPNIKSFVGGDIASGLLATRLHRRKGNCLFIDLGTNGEIVLKTAEALVASSTAAGPAFEGMNISCGMPAFPGAIYKVESQDRRLRLFTIGNQPARGVCGTGLIDLIAISLEEGWISANGKILTEERTIHAAKNIRLTQSDVRQMQLACAAIKTGIRLMLKQNGLRETDLDKILIAGAFGSYLNIQNAMRIGLLPSLAGGRIIFVGNSSLAGARLLLLAAKERERIEKLIQRIQYVSLASDPRFEDEFVQALEFKSWPTLGEATPGKKIFPLKNKEGRLNHD